MKTIINILLISFSTWAAHADFVFDDFSSLTYSPTTMGTLTNSGFVLTITGDDGSFFSDSNNGSTNAMTLGNKLPATQIESLTLGFSTPVSALRLDLDAMHEVQGDSITTSGGVWISFPATLNLSVHDQDQQPLDARARCARQDGLRWPSTGVIASQPHSLREFRLRD